MNELDSRAWEIFLEVYESLPRQGPGNRGCAERALGFCRDLPPEPVILDLGCGTGAQTIHLAELTSGSIVAVDNHGPTIERIHGVIRERGLSPRVAAIVGDMAYPPHPPDSFDLVWSEGALYNIGLREALHVCRGLLQPGGYLAFTDAVWRKGDPPEALKAGFDEDYPTMGWVEDDLATIEDAGLEVVSHFTLPEEAWWDDFYTPMEDRIAALRGEYSDDADALAILDYLAEEPAVRHRFSEFYAYEFFIARRPSARS